MFSNLDDPLMSDTSAYLLNDYGERQSFVPGQNSQFKKNEGIFISDTGGRGASQNIIKMFKHVGNLYKEGDIHYTLYKLDWMRKRVNTYVSRSFREEFSPKLKKGINSLIKDLCIRKFDKLSKPADYNTRAPQKQLPDYREFCLEKIKSK